ncbi:unnamed protein product [Brassica rapa subsp. narinosa]
MYKARSNLAKSGQISRNAFCPCGSRKRYKKVKPTLKELSVTMMDQGSIELFMTQVTEQALGVIDLKRQWKEQEEAYACVDGGDCKEACPRG